MFHKISCAVAVSGVRGAARTVGRRTARRHSAPARAAAAAARAGAPGQRFVAAAGCPAAAAAGAGRRRRHRRRRLRRAWRRDGRSTALPPSRPAPAACQPEARCVRKLEHGACALRHEVSQEGTGTRLSEHMCRNECLHTSARYKCTCKQQRGPALAVLLVELLDSADRAVAHVAGDELRVPTVRSHPLQERLLVRLPNTGVDTFRVLCLGDLNVRRDGRRCIWRHGALLEWARMRKCSPSADARSPRTLPTSNCQFGCYQRDV